MNSNQTILICDDHPLFRKGVLSCLAVDPGLRIIGEASNGEACITKLKVFEPDILITDLSMPGMNGFDVLSWVRDNMPQIRVFILSMHAELQYLERAIDLGAAGFLAKEDAQSELLAAIRQDNMRFYTSESIGTSNSVSLLSPQDGDIEKAMRNVSGAEKRVLALLTQTLTSKQIANRLNISPRTVEAHRANLAEKLNVKGPNKLLELAIKYKHIITGT